MCACERAWMRWVCVLPAVTQKAFSAPLATFPSLSASNFGEFETCFWQKVLKGQCVQSSNLNCVPQAEFPACAGARHQLVHAGGARASLRLGLPRRLERHAAATNLPFLESKKVRSHLQRRPDLMLIWMTCGATNNELFFSSCFKSIKSAERSFQQTKKLLVSQAPTCMRTVAPAECGPEISGPDNDVKVWSWNWFTSTFPRIWRWERGPEM